MSGSAYMASAVLVMALVTYIPRVLPLALFRGRIENRFVTSFLSYVPYAVLAAMTLPDILFSTASIFSAIPALAVAVILALHKRSLLTVALCASGTVFIAERLLEQLRII